jgi:retinol dehydrogenase 12
VTGGSSGLGKELARILYEKGAKVYLAARSREKAEEAINDIQKSTSVPQSGELIFLSLDLADLAAVKEAAQHFLRQESTLHVLFNNAGVMLPPKNSKTAQGYELQFGVNCIGTYVFTMLLTPLLEKTAKISAPSTVRVVWVSSTAIEASYALEGGIDLDNVDFHQELPPWTVYAVSKAAGFFHATEYAKRYKDAGIVSVPLHPGIVHSDLWRFQRGLGLFLMKTLLFHPTILGTYTVLFAGLSPKVTIERTGQWGKSNSHDITTPV